MEPKAAFLPIAKPWLDDEDVRAAGRAILSGWVTQGPEVAAFEAEFAAFTGAPYACAVSSCTTALHLALVALGVGPGDEVITVSHSFIATANAIRYCGAAPVFVDIDPATFNLDPDQLDSAFTAKTRAVLAVHQMGMPCDLGRIVNWAHRRGVPVVEDAACAAGSEILWQGRWEKIGRPHGHVACFSFHPRKIITTGDGGMLTTADPDLDRRFRLLRQHGMTVPDSVRHGSAKVIFESYETLGFNYRLTDIQAAMGRVQLARLPAIISERRRLARRYLRMLSEVPGLGLPTEPEWARSNWQSFCVRLPTNFGVDKQHLVMQKMLDLGIATRRGIMCAHREPAYAVELWGCADKAGGCGCPAGCCKALRRSELAQDQSIVLPLFHGMTDHDQNRVVASLRQTLELTDVVGE